MATILIPTRIIPGCLLGGLFGGMGLFCSAAVSVPLAQHHFQPISLASVPIMAFAIWFIVYVWRGPKGGGNASKITSVSPKLLAGILAFSLLVGLVTGGMIGSLVAQ